VGLQSLLEDEFRTVGAVTHPDRRRGATAVTPRAAEVVRLIARGGAMKQVAADLGLDSNAALVRYAIHNEML
jgi:DNA-binding NarL/FixJ family response regulator